MLRSLVNFRFPFSSQALVRLPGPRPHSIFWFQNLVWTCSARFSIFDVQSQAGFLCNCPAPVWIQVATFWFLVSDSSLDLLQSLLNLPFQIYSWTRAIAWLQPGFWFPLSGSRFEILVWTWAFVSQFPDSIFQKSLMRLCGFSLESCLQF